MQLSNVIGNQQVVLSKHIKWWKLIRIQVKLLLNMFLESELIYLYKKYTSEINIILKVICFCILWYLEIHYRHFLYFYSSVYIIPLNTRSWIFQNSILRLKWSDFRLNKREILRGCRWEVRVSVDNTEYNLNQVREICIMCHCYIEFIFNSKSWWLSKAYQMFF